VLTKKPIAEAVPDLVERALKAGGERCDNVTVLVVEWEAAEAQNQQREVSTRSLGDDVFASTIQASLGADGGIDELDDAEIERSIREINEAIQRSAGSKAR
jgi:PPM family protein phosphatase